MFHWLSQWIPVPNNYNNIAKRKQISHSTSIYLTRNGRSVGAFIFVPCSIYGRKQITIFRTHTSNIHQTWKFHNKFYENLYYCPNVIHLKLSPNKVWHITLKIKMRWPPCGGRCVNIRFYDCYIVQNHKTNAIFVVFWETNSQQPNVKRIGRWWKWIRSKTIDCHRLLIAECWKTFDIQTFRSILNLRMTCFCPLFQI